MNKLTIIKGMDCYEILVNQYKLIYGSRYDIQFDIIRTLQRVAHQTKPSEYGEQYNIGKVLINDKEINAKNTFISYIHKGYSIQEDMKLTSKSLILKYLELYLQDKQFFDTINTINILFQSLKGEMQLSSDVIGIFNEMSAKPLIKLLTPQYQVDDIQKDEYDLSIEEIILFQLNLIEYISLHQTIYSNMLICIEIPTLTQAIYEKIQQLKDCMILIITYHLTDICHDINQYYICERKCFDIADDQQLYQVVCDNNFNLLNLKEGRYYMEKYIFDRDTQEARFIRKIIE